MKIYEKGLRLADETLLAWVLSYVLSNNINPRRYHFFRKYAIIIKIQLLRRAYDF